LEVNSTPRLTFPISEENTGNYNSVGIIGWSFDRADLSFDIKTLLRCGYGRGKQQ
jgi:hypothetical protein